VVEDPRRYQPYAEPWLSNDYGLDLSAGQPLVVNTWRKVNAQAEQLLVPPQQWAALDYRTIEHTDVVGQIAWQAERAGTAHGVLVWFDAELGDGIGFSNAPGKPELVYGQAFFPLQAPIGLEPGDRIEVQLRANLVGSDYLWSWDTKVSTPGSEGVTKADYHQSTFYGAPLDPEKLRRREAGFVPRVEQVIEIDRLCLSLIDGSTGLGDIARQVTSRFPQHFARWQDALTHHFP
jgi:type I protein arginine methyltransferase